MKTKNEIGQQIKINGRNYTIEAVFQIGENTAKVCPWLAAQYGVRGERGAVAMLQEYANGILKLIVVNRSNNVEIQYPA